MWDELENGLSWFASAPSRWVTSAKKDLSAAAEWIWTVIQGDFADDQTTAQTITGTVISMIPFVDQLCDVRDIVANCRKIHEDTSNKWAWVALVLTLIGLFPTLGSLAKGCFKILFAYGRKSALHGAKVVLDSSFWKASKPFVEAGIAKLNDFLGRPEVRKALKSLKWDNPYGELAKIARKLAGEINVNALLQAMDSGLATLHKLVDLIDRWGTAAMRTQAGALLNLIRRIRAEANQKLAEVLSPIQHWVDSLARRLEIEADMNYRAYTNTINPHAFQKPSPAAEITELTTRRPAWVDVRAKQPYPSLDVPPAIPPGYPNVAAKTGILRGKYDTFHTMGPIEIPPGTTLYRVLDPSSSDNSICWMSKAEFAALSSKSDWRRRFAVWANWNSNGEFVTYIVPAGRPLKVWEGVTASQQLADASGKAISGGAPGKGLMLEGGARQIVLDPADLDRAYLSKRQPTGWGYSNFGESTSLIGVPTLRNYWYEAKP